MVNAPQSPLTLNSRVRSSRRRIQLAFVAVFLLTLCSPTRAVRRDRMIDTWRPVHYAVTLKFNEGLTELAEARTEIKVLALKPVSQLDLDFGDMTIDSITVNYQVARFEQRTGT